LNDREFADSSRFLFFEIVSDCRLVDESRANNENVQNSDLAKDDVSDKRRQFDESHWLFHHFLLNFSHVRISFQTSVDLHAQDSYVRFRLYDVWFDSDRDRHVELLKISSEMNQLVLRRDKDELVSSRSFLAQFVYSFEISAIFVRAFFVGENIHIVDVSQRSRVDLESVAHFQ
jgi:hypothetical protein